MERLHIDYDLGILALETFCIELYKKTGSDAVGVVVAYSLAGLLGETLVEREIFQGLKVIILKDLPEDWWFVYNHKSAIFSPGA